MVKEHLQVYARIKPLESKSQALPYLALTDRSLELQVSRTKLSNAKDSYNFAFNHIFPENSQQEQVFETVARPVIDSCLEGYNGTIFAYGQTGSGKTYTMSGGQLWQDRGIIPRVLTHIFEEFQRRSKQYSFELYVSFIQIYNENAYDLLQENHEQIPLEQCTKIVFLEDEEANLQMKNLSVHKVTTQDEAIELLGIGSYIRKTNATKINQASSRSHSIFTLNVKAKDLSNGDQLFSKIHLVDLAGSQRVSKSHAQGIVLTEAKSINLSLTYLEQVIVALNQKAKSKSKGPHIPYRNSMLTTLLKDSLGGNCKTVMIATISMDRSNQDETISTLRFAQRVKLIQNETVKNEKHLYSNRIESLQRQNAALRRQLMRYQSEGGEQSEKQVLAKVQRYMNSQDGDLCMQNMGQVRLYFRKMRQIYQSKINQYTKDLIYISEKLTRYDQIVEEKQRRRV